jgi:hypothetical protein
MEIPPMLMTPLGIVTVVNLVQPMKMLNHRGGISGSARK